MALSDLIEKLKGAGVEEGLLAEVRSAVEGPTDEVERLRETRVEHLEEAKRAKEKLAKFVDDKGKPVNPDDLPGIFRKLSKAVDLDDDDKAEEMARRFGDPVRKEFEPVVAERDELRTALNEGIEERLAAELARHGVTDDDHREGALGILLRKRKYIMRKNKDGRYGAYEDLGEAGGFVPLAKSVEEWAKTDSAKKFKTARDNSGGNASGGEGRSEDNGAGPDPFAKATWNVTKQGQLKRTDPKRYERLRAAYQGRKAAGEQK